MARESKPRTARGKQCIKCGEDEWVEYSGKWRCSPCDRNGARRRKRRERSRPERALMMNAQTRAREAGVPFTITSEDVASAWPEDGRCPILGIPLKAGRGRTHDGSPTLDRLNPEWGYEPGNVAVISHKANRAKSNLTAQELRLIADWMEKSGLV